MIVEQKQSGPVYMVFSRAYPPPPSAAGEESSDRNPGRRGLDVGEGGVRVTRLVEGPAGESVHEGYEHSDDLHRSHGGSPA